MFPLVEFPKRCKNIFTKYNNNLSIAERDALIRYTSADYAELNKTLRDGLDITNLEHQEEYEDFIKWITVLDRIIQKSPKCNIRSFTVYRGGNSLMGQALETTGVLNNVAYTSSSASLSEANRFVQDVFTSGESCCLFSIAVNKDAPKYDYISLAIGKTKGEDEILFKRNTHFQLVEDPFYKRVGTKVVKVYPVTINDGVVIVQIDKHPDVDYDAIKTSIVEGMKDYAEILEDESAEELYEIAVQDYLSHFPTLTIPKMTKDEILHTFMA